MCEAIREYLKMPSLGHMSISYLVWKLRKAFSDRYLPRNIVIVITYPDGKTKVVSIWEFQIIRKTLPLAAVFRIISLDEI